MVDAAKLLSKSKDNSINFIIVLRIYVNDLKTFCLESFMGFVHVVSGRDNNYLVAALCQSFGNPIGPRAA